MESSDPEVILNFIKWLRASVVLCRRRAVGGSEHEEFTLKLACFYSIHSVHNANVWLTKPPKFTGWKTPVNFLWVIFLFWKGSSERSAHSFSGELASQINKNANPCSFPHPTILLANKPWRLDYVFAMHEQKTLVLQRTKALQTDQKGKGGWIVEAIFLLRFCLSVKIVV